MSRGLPIIYLAACTLGVIGCGDSSNPKVKARVDVAEGEQDLVNERTQRGLEVSTSGDFGKMTEANSQDTLFQKAMKKFDEAIAADPNSADAYYERGFACLQYDKDEKAIGDFTQAIQLDPKHAKAFLMRSRAYGDLGDEAKAMADRDKALQLDPHVDD